VKLRALGLRVRASSALARGLATKTGAADVIRGSSGLRVSVSARCLTIECVLLL